MTWPCVTLWLGLAVVVFFMAWQAPLVTMLLAGGIVWLMLKGSEE